MGRHRQDRTGGFPQYLLGNRAEQEPVEPCSPVRSHDQKIRAPRQGLVHDGGYRFPSFGGELDVVGRESRGVYRLAKLLEHLLARHRIHELDRIEQVLARTSIGSKEGTTCNAVTGASYQFAIAPA